MKHKLIFAVSIFCMGWMNDSFGTLSDKILAGKLEAATRYVRASHAPTLDGTSLISLMAANNEKAVKNRLESSVAFYCDEAVNFINIINFGKMMAAAEEEKKGGLETSSSAASSSCSSSSVNQTMHESNEETGREKETEKKESVTSESIKTENATPGVVEKIQTQSVFLALYGLAANIPCETELVFTTGSCDSNEKRLTLHAYLFEIVNWLANLPSTKISHREALNRTNLLFAPLVSHVPSDKNRNKDRNLLNFQKLVRTLLTGSGEHCQPCLTFSKHQSKGMGGCSLAPKLNVIDALFEILQIEAYKSDVEKWFKGFPVSIAVLKATIDDGNP